MKKSIIVMILSLISVMQCRVYNSIVMVQTGWGLNHRSPFLADKADVVVLGKRDYAGIHCVEGANKNKVQLHLLPSEIVQPKVECYLTAGVDIDPDLFLKDIEVLKKEGIKTEGRMWLSDKSHIVMPYHRKLDALMAKRYSNSCDNGSCKGIGMLAADKHLRLGLRIADLLDEKRFKAVLKEGLDWANSRLISIFKEKPFKFDDLYLLYSDYAQRLAPYVKKNAEICVNKAIKKNKIVLLEGGHGTSSDLFMGSYPYVSATDTTAAGICAGAGVGPSRVGHTLCMVPACVMYQGIGPFPAEIVDKNILANLKKVHCSCCFDPNPMRYGWIDLVMLRQAIALNGAHSLAISRLDQLDGLDKVKICYDYIVDGKSYDYLPAFVSDAKKIEPCYITVKGWKDSTHAKTYNQLPPEARAYLSKIEQLTGDKISFVSVGPDADNIITMNKLLPFE